MFLLLMVPVVVLVATAHRLLQFYAPSNAVITRVGASLPKWRSALLLAILAATTLVLMHLLAEAIAAGAPVWLNLVVLILAWDSIKFSVMSVLVGLRAIRCLLPLN